MSPLSMADLLFSLYILQAQLSDLLALEQEETGYEFQKIPLLSDISNLEAKS